ncbi:hypothetical protein [Actinacidiphila sp. ITFR-21]|uniref:hypothetical protein n=1 Tax=Actinacidiphila sp. ITFR-21 TaxID=3075199 RepID=UPI002889CEA5|nr:hypothetical protein [Streptomyces sp. ITFR-21]WNI15722.1 hypothetical protein RLT57_09425 [Streptomyces sp. ITFR-21]
MNAPASPLLLAARRLRLLAVLAGLAWLMGVHPGVPVRLLALALVLDALADTRPRTRIPRAGAPSRLPRLIRKGGVRQ